METSWSRCGGRGEVSYAGEDPNIEVHDSTRCRGQSMRWQESVMFSDPDDTGRFGATGQYFGGQEWRGVRQQAAIKTIHSTSVSGGSAARTPARRRTAGTGAAAQPGRTTVASVNNTAPDNRMTKKNPALNPKP